MIAKGTRIDRVIEPVLLFRLHGDARRLKVHPAILTCIPRQSVCTMPLKTATVGSLGRVLMQVPAYDDTSGRLDERCDATGYILRKEPVRN